MTPLPNLSIYSVVHGATHTSKCFYESLKNLKFRKLCSAKWLTEITNGSQEEIKLEIPSEIVN